MNEQSKAVHGKNQISKNSCSRVQPIHIAAVRKSEALCILRDIGGNDTAEWVEVEDIDNFEALPENDSTLSWPQVQVEDWLEEYSQFMRD